MQAILMVLVRIAMFALSAMQMLMLIRAIFSWFPIPESLSGVYRVIYQITEPIVTPFRKLFYNAPWAHRLPIDISFAAAFFALVILQRLFMWVVYGVL